MRVGGAWQLTSAAACTRNQISSIFIVNKAVPGRDLISVCMFAFKALNWHLCGDESLQLAGGARQGVVPEWAGDWRRTWV